MLQRLLMALDRQRTDALFTFSMVVADNDAQLSARQTVAEFARESKIKAIYCSQPKKNIALTRNEGLENATGDYIAFIDDDEFPAEDWLLRMVKTCEDCECAGVLGPVRPHFEESPPRWIIDGRFCERPEHQTGRIMPWEETRTGNVLFSKRILKGEQQAFNPQFPNGGEDKDFFMRMIQKGHEFRWCNEGVVYETVPHERWKRGYMLRRALLRGKNILKHPTGRARILTTSAVAVPLYLLLLLPALVFGQHCFMKYCIKLCDHLGRLLAFARINPVSER